MNSSISHFAPASIGNFIVGFDVLGLAVAPIDGGVLGDEVKVVAAERSSLEITGDYAAWVPQGEQNLAWQAIQLVQQWLQQNKQPIIELNLTLHKGLPVASGTGSSAASVVAAVQGICRYLQTQHDIAIPMQDRWRMMAELEGGISGAEHLDNLAPAALGGLVLCPLTGLPQALPFFDNWYVVLAYSGQRLLTREARACLPAVYPRANAIEQIQRMAAVIDGLHRQDRVGVVAHLQDALAEPYRAELIDGYTNCKAWLQQQGALAVGISGAGPAFFGLTDSLDQAQQLADGIRQRLPLQAGGFIHICQPWQLPAE